MKREAAWKEATKAEVRRETRNRCLRRANDCSMGEDVEEKSGKCFLFILGQNVSDGKLSIQTLHHIYPIKIPFLHI